MLELFQFGPAFKLPSPSPFCIKLELLLKIAGIPYTNRYDADVRKAPKAKLPFVIEDGNTTIADSELVMRYLTETGQYKEDAWLSAEQHAQCITITRLVEEHLYWLMVDSRWLNDEVWPLLEKEFFSGLPPLVKSIVPGIARRQVRKTLYGQGLGRHHRDELDYFARQDLAALDVLLGDDDYLMGNRICSVDATVYGLLACIYYPDFNTPLKVVALDYPRLLAYCDRITGQYFPKYSRSEFNA